jgi:acetyl esterase
MQLASAPGPYKTSDVDYLTVEGRTLQATIYRPAGPGPFPALLDVHGGQWTIPTSSRHGNAPVNKFLASHGMLVVAVDFRQDREHHFPDSMADVNYAMRWLRANAEEIGAAPQPIGALGTSSGGHLVMQNAMRPADSSYSFLPVAGVSAEDASPDYAILHSPIIDPIARREFARQTGRDDILRSTEIYFVPPETIEDINPQRMLDRGERLKLPPVLLLQGTADKNLDHRMQDRFAASYRAAGGGIQLEKFPEASHVFFNQPGPHTDRCLEVVRQFIDRQLGG